MKLLTNRNRILANPNLKKQRQISQLSKLMEKSSQPYIRSLEKDWPHLKGELQPKVARDAAVLEKVQCGQFAWCFVNGHAFLVELQRTDWKKRWQEEGSKPHSSPPLFLADRYRRQYQPYFGYDTNDIQTAMDFLEYLARNSRRAAYFLIDIPVAGDPSIRLVQCFELLGRAYSHYHCAKHEFRFNDLERDHEHEWRKAFDEEFKQEMAARRQEEEARRAAFHGEVFSAAA